MGRWLKRPAAVTPIVAFAVAAVAAGCSPSGDAPRAQRPSTAPASAAHCGTGLTAAGVTIVVEVEHGSVACSVARSVERAYSAALASGKVPGNGGGAPVTIQGWRCQGFNTPVVLKTGRASQCVRGPAEILAVLPPPSAAPRSDPSPRRTAPS